MGGRAVVTGAAGFAGTWLCRELRAHGREVIGWVRRPTGAPVAGVAYRQQDLRDARGVIRALSADGPDEVYHLGAVSHVGDCRRDPDRAIAVNVGGTEHLLAGLPGGARFLFASSCHVYGRPMRLPVDEDHPLCPESLYGRTKETAERLVLAAARGGRHAVVARAFHHTGPGQQARYALADWARQLGRDRQAPVQTGDLSLRRDYSDVRDVVAGYRLLLERAEPGSIVQLCSGQAPPLWDLLATLNGGQLPAVQERPERTRADDIPTLVGSPALAESLGWTRQRALVDTLRELAASVGWSGG